MTSLMVLQGSRLVGLNGPSMIDKKFRKYVKTPKVTEPRSMPIEALDDELIEALKKSEPPPEAAQFDHEVPEGWL